MRFLANENFPGDAVSALELSGHDVVWIRTAAPGCKDEDILEWAVREGGILLTFDKRTDWAGHFTVLEPGRIRMRPLWAQ